MGRVSQKTLDKKILEDEPGPLPNLRNFARDREGIGVIWGRVALHFEGETDVSRSG